CLDAQVHGRQHPAVGPLCDRQARGVVDRVGAVARIALPAQRVRLVRRVDGVGQVVVEVELGRQYGLLVPVDLDVHVHRAARIPAGVDAGELGDPVRVGDLRPAQVGRIAGGDGFGVADAVRAVGFGGGALGCAVRRTG